MATEYKPKDPEEVAKELVEAYSGDGEGILRDSLVEAQVQAENHAYHMQQVCIACDYVLDDPAIYGKVVSSALSDMYDTANTLYKFFDELGVRLKTEIDNL